MSYYANELREHGRNDFDEAAADELDRLEDENSKLREVIKQALDALKQAKYAIKGREHTGFIDLAIAALLQEQPSVEPVSAPSDEQESDLGTFTKWWYTYKIFEDENIRPNSPMWFARQGWLAAINRIGQNTGER